MKKFIYSVLFMAVAIAAATSFTACGDDDKDGDFSKTEETKEKYYAAQHWVSDDVLAIADVEVKGTSAAFTESKELKASNGQTISGKVCRVELTGDQVDKVSYEINFSLKSNWKELVAGKQAITLLKSSARVNSKGATAVFENPFGGVITVEQALADEAHLKRSVAAISFSY